MKSFRIEDKNFYQAILPVLEQCFEVVNHPDRYHRGIYYRFSKWDRDLDMEFFALAKDGLHVYTTYLTKSETDILYKFGGETFTKIVEHYLSPDSEVSMGMITKWGHSTEFFFTKTKENYYVDFVNLHPEDVDEILRIR